MELKDKEYLKDLSQREPAGVILAALFEGTQEEVCRTLDLLQNTPAEQWTDGLSEQVNEYLATMYCKGASFLKSLKALPNGEGTSDRLQQLFSSLALALQVETRQMLLFPAGSMDEAHGRQMGLFELDSAESLAA